ncbi:hypothetical protein GCM10011385_25280 [Nitratireductor aestuarii]|uniref:Uncharacterized protein n=1 Tax=Nitratireductor aestuarii TaxID=1735103 RepID=A0A916W697_9HYPH|nr:hypothetical protein GCM10011385_25280 [Nitratireductor aestuarii]
MIDRTQPEIPVEARLKTDLVHVDCIQNIVGKEPARCHRQHHANRENSEQLKMPKKNE